MLERELSDARKAIDNLRARDKKSNELPNALQQEADQFTKITGIPCVIDVLALDFLSNYICEYTLRDVSEGLMNVARHGQAHHAWDGVNQVESNGETGLR